MSPTTQGTLVLIVTLLMLVSGIPVAFGLGAIAIAFLVLFQGFDALHVVAETFWSGLDEFTLVAIPMFVMMGAAIGSSPAGKDLYEALDRWLYRLPGGLVISNLGACAIFAALTGSSPACCAAIGKMGIPEMRRRGYPDDVATGSICAGGTLGILIPPSITFILYGIATETSIGRLFIAGVLPGLMLTGLFMLWTVFIIWKRGFRSHAIDFRYSWKEKFQSIPKIAPFIFIIWKRGFRSHAIDFRYSWKEKFQSIPKIAPFLAIIFGVMYSLYGGVATPSEAAGVGAALCLFLAILIYRLWKVEQIWLILRDTMRESVMILTIIATAVLFGYMLTSLYLTQTLAQAIADLHANKWMLMFLINIFLLVCGFFIPPAAIILMTSPILLPIITAAGFDPVWFGVILTINMEIGLIHPPVGLNIYIVNAIAPDVPLAKVMWGTLPYVICMMLAIVILCFFPEIATWLPNHLMGVAIGPK
ncbi:MAG: TRAP transporter large permease [Pseudolabrys sp.]